MNGPFSVLLIEEDEADYLITSGLLAAQDRTRFELDWRPHYESALEAIRARRHDAYLVDYRLGHRTGLELIQEGFGSGLRAPVIMLTDQSDHEIDLEAAALGVTDYLVKSEIDSTSLERSIRYAIAHHRAVRDLAESEERYALAVRATNDGIWDWDLTQDRLYLSPRWHEILGRRDGGGHQPPSAWFELVHGDDLAILQAAIEAHIAGQTPHLESEHRMLRADGSWRWVLIHGLASRDEHGVATRMAGSLSDVTDRRAAELRLRHDALHDALTGLPNRALFMDRADHVVQRAHRDPEAGCAVLFLDVDRFKVVNDSLSHAVGDQLLRALALRVASTLRPGDTVARMGGDEFTLLLEGVSDATQAQLVAARIQQAITRVFRIDGHELFVTVSIGIALGSPWTTAAELLRNSDIAMYDAKRRGRGRSALFDESMHRRAVDRLSRENELRQLVERGLLPVNYQPIVDLVTGEIRGFEALARWPGRPPDVGPLDFIPIAEETGLIGDLGLHVLRTSLEALAGWRDSGLISEAASMSVNVSPRQLEDPEFPRRVRAVLAAAGLPSAVLRLEVTESTLMKDPERIEAIAQEVSASGVVLQLDDFGTGYSSLAALHRFPVDALKIDRSFIGALSDERDGGDTIVRSTIALGNSLGLRVIAEGIERPFQLQRLRELGCELGQGFVLSHPLSDGAIESLLSQWTPAEVVALGESAGV